MQNKHSIINDTVNDIKHSKAAPWSPETPPSGLITWPDLEGLVDHILSLMKKDLKSCFSTLATLRRTDLNSQPYSLRVTKTENPWSKILQGKGRAKPMFLKLFSMGIVLWVGMEIQNVLFHKSLCGDIILANIYSATGLFSRDYSLLFSLPASISSYCLTPLLHSNWLDYLEITNWAIYYEAKYL